MFDSLLGFRDEEERNEFLIALPVLAFFGCLLYWFVFGGDVQVKKQYAKLTGAVVAVDTDVQSAAAEMEALFVAAAEEETTEKPVNLIAEKNTPEVVEPVTPVVNTSPDSPIAEVVLLEQDRDNDGVDDIDDKCPDTAGDQANGCVSSGTTAETEPEPEPQPQPEPTPTPTPTPIDSDQDGVADESDQCPNQVGPASNGGCPADTDGDGVSDSFDLCPQSAGVAINRGCPADSDADGLPDNQDQCPEQAGTLETGGCPADSDSDTVPDGIDACPDVAGDADNQGCPGDRDSDGVADAEDACPDVAGDATNNGCPAETTQVTSLGTGITFETASARLTEESRELLDSVARILARYPSVNLLVEGHTDDSGDADINLKLSEQRARACTTYLASKGIDPARMQAIGFGETQPLVPNDTAEARERNRRVEFKLSN